MLLHLLVPCSQEDLDYYMFWATVYHSNLPYFKAQAAFIHNTILISVWKVGWQTETSIQVIKCVSAACRVIDCQFQLDPVVAPRMPLPRLSPELQLRPAEKSSLVTAIGDAEAFQVGAHSAGRVKLINMALVCSVALNVTVCSTLPWALNAWLLRMGGRCM